MPAVLVVEDARKRFDQVQALDGASLDLARGECLGVLGPNGAGKSTLARAIVGRVRLDSGTIHINSERMGSAAASASRHKVSLIPQEIALYQTLSAVENLRLFGELNGLSGNELSAQIRWALEWTALGERADTPVDQFSGGMKRRLNLACGVLHAPSIVLLDEPTVGVDPQSRAHIWTMLQTLRETGTALLLTTHQLDEAEQQCARIVIIDDGRTIATGTVSELVSESVGAHLRLDVQLVNESLGAFRHATLTPNEEAIIEVPITDPATEIARALDIIAAAGGQVADVKLRNPSLQSAFLQLTGRELRDD